MRSPVTGGLVSAALGMAILACTEAPGHVTEPPAFGVSGQPDPVDPDPDPGDDTYFDADVTWEFTGDYDGFDFPTAERAVTFHLLQVIQLGELRTYVTRPSTMRILTANVPVDLDSATHIPSMHLRSTQRGAGTLPLPDSTTAYNNWQHAAQGGSPAASWSSPTRTLAAAVATERDREGPGRRSAVGGFYGPAAAAKELARLRSSGAAENRTGPARLQFRLDRAGQRYVFDFDEAIGAITSTQVSDAGRSVATTTREFVPVAGGHRLAAVSTVLYDSDGQPRRTIRETFRNVKTRPEGR